MHKNKTSPSPFPWKFFVLTFLLTWACWIPAGLLPAGQFGVLMKILHYSGGIMPTLVALLLLYIYRNHQERKDYWQRLFSIKFINKVWWAVILLTVPILTSIGSLLGLLLGDTWAKTPAASDFVHSPLSLIPFAVFIFLFGPLPEEMAWRGYALDRLQSRFNALFASLILGAAWTLWHLPLFWIEGTYQHGLGVGTPQFWLFMADKIPQSVLMTWIYNNTRRSTASAILFHFMINFWGELIDLSLRAEYIYIAAWWIVTIVVIAAWKPKRLVRLPREPEKIEPPNLRST